MSAPGVGERVRRLEDTGIITGYGARIDPARSGYGLPILIRAKPLPGEMDTMIDATRKTPQIVACDQISGDDCFVARAHLRDVTEMAAVIDGLLSFGATSPSVVQSAPVPERLVGI